MQFQCLTGLDKAPTAKRVPVEGEAVDVDGVPIYFLIHVVDGYLTELEIYEADGSPVCQIPAADSIAVFSLPSPPAGGTG